MDASSLIFTGCFTFLWIVFIWDFYLSIRQYRKYRETKDRPIDLYDVIDEESFQKARLYKLDKARFGFAMSIWGQLETTIVLLYNLIPIFWNISGHIIASWNLADEIWQSMVFVTIVTIIGKIINMPWKLYDTFVIEQKHGFNKQTLGFFIKDQIKSLIVSLLIGMPIMGCVIWIIRVGGDYFFVYVWIFVTLVGLILMTVYPEFIAPLFDKYTALPEGELRTKIEALASKLEFPLKKLYVVEGSKRSAHSNAYLYGIWNNKRIVLYDTLLANYVPLNHEDKADGNASGDAKVETEDSVKTDESDDAAKTDSPKRKKLGMNDDEVVAVIGHELGHWKLNHTLYNIVISEVNMFLCLAVFALLFKQTSLYEAFGFVGTQPILIGLTIIFEYIFAPYNEILSFLITCWSRRMEFQADSFSAELGYARLMRTALIKLEKDNLSFPVDDWLYSAWHYSHPPVPERVAAMKKYE